MGLGTPTPLRSTNTKAVRHKPSPTTAVVSGTIHIPRSKKTNTREKQKHRYHGYQFSTTTTTTILSQNDTKTTNNSLTQKKTNLFKRCVVDLRMYVCMRVSI